MPLPSWAARDSCVLHALREGLSVVKLIMAIALRLVLGLAFLLCAAAPAPAQIHDGKVLVKASLLADTSSIVAGQSFQVGLLLEMAPGWHTYWQYSGDSGLPTSIDWELPPGFTAGPIEWPLPQAKIEPGDIQVYSYSGKVLLLTTITPPANLLKNVTLRARATWLVCEEICVPGEANLELTLPVAQSAVPANAAVFEEFRAQLPSKQAPPFDLTWTR